MTKYEIETPIGFVVCYEVNGTYYLLNEKDYEKFNKQDILNIERITNES